MCGRGKKPQAQAPQTSKSLQEELNDARAKNDNLERALKESQDKLKHAQQALDVARSTEKLLRNELADSKAQNKRLEMELYTVQHELKNTRDELQRCRAAQVSGQLTEQGLRQDLDKVMIENKKLKKELEEVHQELSNTRGRLERAYALQVESLHQKEQTLEYKLMQATMERDAAQARASELANRLSTAMAKRDTPGTSSVRGRNKLHENKEEFYN